MSSSLLKFEGDMGLIVVDIPRRLNTTQSPSEYFLLILASPQRSVSLLGSYCVTCAQHHRHESDYDLDSGDLRGKRGPHSVSGRLTMGRQWSRG